MGQVEKLEAARAESERRVEELMRRLESADEAGKAKANAVRTMLFVVD